MPLSRPPPSPPSSPPRPRPAATCSPASSGTTVSTTWLEAGKIPDVAGNWHFGDLFVEATSRGRARAFGTVFDVTCRDDVAVPYNPGGGHGFDAPPPPEEEDPACVLPGAFSYRIESDGPAVLRLRDGRVLRLAGGSNTGTLPARR